jgi:hypothetical protein
VGEGLVSGPFFIVDGHDASVHEYLGDVEAFLEAYDVEAGRLRLFQADGTELRLTTSGPPPPSPPWQRRVVATEDVVGHDPAALAEALRAGLLVEHDSLVGRLVGRLMGRRTHRDIDRDAIRQADLEVLVAEFRKAHSGARG